MRITPSYVQLFSLAFLSLTFPSVSARAQDTTRTRLNTIKLNLISSALYEKTLVMSFERVTKPNQSWAVMIGYVQFPKIGNFNDSIYVKDDSKSNGYVFGGEYRFYLKKENKYPAPHGVYLGPYLNFFSFDNERIISFKSNDGANTVTEATLTTDLRVLNIGAQLGYQFVINDRWTFDMVIVGPSLSHYTLKADLQGNYNPSDGTELGNRIVTAMLDHFPLLKDLVTNKSVAVNGTSREWGKGFRYQLNIGYRFGKKKMINN